MRRSPFLLFPSLVLTLSCSAPPTETPAPAAIEFSGSVAEDLAKVDDAIADGPFQADWASLEGNGIPEWFLDAKLGIFIHWGVYSVPAYGSEWYPRFMYLNRPRRGVNMFEHHRDTWGDQKEFGYKDFIPMFKAENFDAAAWADVFEASGARYVVPVAEHHDGFPMYASSYTGWDASEMGPKRDIVAELAEAVRARGMKLGVSSHRAFNWVYYNRLDEFDTADEANAGLYGKADHANYPRNGTPWDPPSREFLEDWLGRTAELVEKFEADLIWFDFGIGPPWQQPHGGWYEPYLQRFAAYYYNRAKSWGKTGIIQYKFEAFPENVAVLDLERARLSGMREPFWQTDTSVSFTSWGYVTNHEYKPTGLIVREFVDIVSKNGCLLLNIGPKPDGAIPEPEVRILREIGDWLKVNGEAIYSARPWKIYGEGPTETVEGHLSERQNKDMTFEDIRYTTRSDTLYATALGWSDSGWKMAALASGSEHLDGDQVAGVQLLGSDAELEWEQTDAGLEIQAPEKSGDFAYVFKISF